MYEFQNFLFFMTSFIISYNYYIRNPIFRQIWSIFVNGFSLVAVLTVGYFNSSFVLGLEVR